MVFFDVVINKRKKYFIFMLISCFYVFFNKEILKIINMMMEKIKFQLQYILLLTYDLLKCPLQMYFNLFCGRLKSLHFIYHIKY